MKKLVITLLAFPCGLFAGNTDNSKTAVQPCGKEAVCDQVVNAIGDPITIEIPSDKIVSLDKDMKLTEERTFKVELPKEPGTQKAYSFTPTTGESKGQIVMVVFDNIQHKPGTRLFGKSQVKVYRRFADDPKSTWYELGKIEYAGLLNKDVSGPLTADITVKTDGTAVWVNPTTKKPSVFLAGTKDLRPAAAKEKAAAEEAKAARA